MPPTCAEIKRASASSSASFNSKRTSSIGTLGGTRRTVVGALAEGDRIGTPTSAMSAVGKLSKLRSSALRRRQDIGLVSG